MKNFFNTDQPRALNEGELCPKCGHFAGFHGTLGSLMNPDCLNTFGHSKFESAVQPSRQDLTDPDTLERYANAEEARLNDIEGNFTIEDEEELFTRLEERGIEPSHDYLDLPLDPDGMDTSDGFKSWDELDSLKDLEEELTDFIDSLTEDDRSSIAPDNPRFQQYLEEHYPSYRGADEFSDLGDEVDFRRVAEEVDWDGDGRSGYHGSGRNDDGNEW